MTLDLPAGGPRAQRDRSGAEDYLEGHVWGIEHLHQLCFEQSKALGRRVEDFTTIIDMEGLSLNHRLALPRLNQAMSLDSQYYPYFVGKLFILHTPFLAPLVYSAVSPFVPKEVRDRMYVLKNNEALLAHIDADQLPVELGGTCRLHGGVTCVRQDSYDPSMSPRHGGDHDALNALHPDLHPELQPQSVQQQNLQQISGEEEVPTLGLPVRAPAVGFEHPHEVEAGKVESERAQRAHRAVI